MTGMHDLRRENAPCCGTFDTVYYDRQIGGSATLRGRVKGQKSYPFYDSVSPTVSVRSRVCRAVEPAEGRAKGGREGKRRGRWILEIEFLGYGAWRTQRMMGSW